MSRNDLLTAVGNTAYYERLYETGYMDAWNTTAKVRLLEFVRFCKPVGRLLDFGCGTGEMAAYIKANVPALECWGADIAANAVKSARRKHPAVNFANIDDLLSDGQTFNTVMTHHVLEHVHDLAGTLKKIARLAAPDGTVIHAMPCGNSGSLEERLVAQLRGGKDPALGNRFIFEDYGHVRRLTSDELIEACEAAGLHIRGAWFCNHFWGALDWITATPMFLTFPNPFQARNLSSFMSLMWWRLLFSVLGVARSPAALQTNFALGDPTKWSPQKRLAVALTKPLAWLSEPAFRNIQSRADNEWATSRERPNGSSMYLAFIKG